jgi:predicted CopG family antitoxin
VGEIVGSGKKTTISVSKEIQVELYALKREMGVRSFEEVLVELIKSHRARGRNVPQGIAEARGKRVRVLVCRADGDVIVEIAGIWNPLCEKPVVLVTSEQRLREDVEALAEEIVQLLRRAVEEVLGSRARRELRQSDIVQAEGGADSER